MMINPDGRQETPGRQTSGHICDGVSKLSSLRWKDLVQLWSSPFHGLRSWAEEVNTS